MEPIDMLRADPLDILFENRNKSYGAYPLRKFYSKRLYISMGITLSVVVLSSFLYLYFHTNTGVRLINPFPEMHLYPVDLTPHEKPVIPPLRPSAPRPPVSTQKVTTLVIVPDNKIIPPIATVNELNNAIIGVKTLAGGPDNGEMPNNGNSQVATAAQTNESVESKPEIFDRAEVMPEFPGGIEALKRFLLRNLRMPETNLDPGSVVRVIARFVVGADGRVRDIEITLVADAVYNIEVRRVISKMPDWKPGSQNHRSVAVYFNLPVNFVGAE